MTRPPPPPLFGYLEVNEKGEFRLCVSIVRLNPAGARLERGRHKQMPEVIYELTEKPEDPELAIRALKSFQRFLEGKEYRRDVLEIGVDELPLVKRKKKDGV